MSVKSGETFLPLSTANHISVLVSMTIKPKRKTPKRGVFVERFITSQLGEAEY